MVAFSSMQLVYVPFIERPLSSVSLFSFCLGFECTFLFSSAFDWHFCEAFCDVHLEYYVKINCIVLFKYLEGFVALQAIFKMTFKTFAKKTKVMGEKRNLLMFPSLAVLPPSDVLPCFDSS